jgi:DNA-binding GntR family transcriptional regulator
MENVNPIKRPSTLNGLAYKEIKNSLITGQLQFNKIYSANYFAGILGVSRTPIREALLQLTNEGCLISVQGQGFKIKEYSAKEIKDFFETRKMIESYVVERVVGSLRETEMRQLEESLKSMVERTKKRADTYGFLEADKDFHMNLVRRYNNFLLVSIMQNIRNLISIFGGKALSHRERFQEVISEHRVILEAIKQKDKKKAVKAIEYHLNTTEKYLLENYWGLGPIDEPRVPM